MIRRTLTIITLFGTATMAWAHSPLKSTIPADNSVLITSPEKVQMIFAKPARMTKIVLIRTTNGAAEETKLKLPSKKFQEKFELASGITKSGSYKIEWRALAKDGHALKGKFSFAVKAK